MDRQSGFYSRQDVLRLTSLSAVTLWRMEKRGEFPKSVKISPGRVGWSRELVDSWLAEKMGAADAKAA